ncbi:hypothetical protein [Falsiroseomonas sp.]|uniref:hypothetical protein n=1 Tax=Falsiroseomonas sp. TaxID=2870721 RepID=UPI00356AE5F1
MRRLQLRGEADYFAGPGDLAAWAGHANPHTYFPSGAPAPGSHAWGGITFLNDRWGGTPDTNRNLYVEGISYNAAVVEGGEVALWSNGRVSISTAQPSVDLL